MIEQTKGGTAAAGASDVVLEGTRLAYEYAGAKGSVAHRVFENVDIRIHRNELVAIVGSTGVGKSTLLRVLGGFLPPASGHVYLRGEEVVHPCSKIGLIHQSIATFPWMTSLDNVKLALTSKDLDDAEKDRIARARLAEVGLADWENHYPKEMSGGMRQKIAIARALAASPSVLLMDEPFVHLDEISAAQLRQEIYSMLFSREAGLDAVVLVSHNLYEVVELADRVYVMRDSPAHIVSDFRIDLPRPRAWRDSSFLLDVDTLRGDLGTSKADLEAPPEIT